MKKFLMILVVALILLFGCASYSAPEQNSPSQTPLQTGSGQQVAPAQNSSQQTSPSASANASVEIRNFAFSPAIVTVSKGATVTWTNNDSPPHSVVSDTGAFDTGVLSNGESKSVTFSTAGTFTYHCGIHPSMKGTVIVK